MLACVGQQGKVPRALHCTSQAALVTCTDIRLATRANLTFFIYEAAQIVAVFVVDIVDTVGSERADPATAATATTTEWTTSTAATFFVPIRGGVIVVTHGVFLIIWLF